MLYLNALDAFKNQLTIVDRSQETIRGYGVELQQFGRYLGVKYNGLVYLDDITVEDMENYQHHLKAKGYSPASRSRVVYVFRSFYNFLYKKDLVEKNLGVKLEPLKIPFKERTYLTEVEFWQLEAAIESILVRAVATTLYMTGLRIMEAMNLTLDDVDLPNKVIMVRAGKGNKDRVIPISDTLYKVLANYLNHIRPEVGTQNFFCTRKSGKLSPMTVNKELHATTERLGWKKIVTCHILRHSFASHLIQKNVNLVQVQRLLGHANLAVTSRYTHTNLEELTKAVNHF